MEIIWAPLAQRRLQEHIDYIAEENPSAASTWAGDVFERIEKLRDFPESGRPIPSIQGSDIRELVVASRRIIYQFDGSDVVILTVRHSRQRPITESELEVK